MEVPLSHKDLLERPIVVALATVMPSGQPQVTPVWCSYDGNYILVNTVRGRLKERNMQANPRVTLLAVDPTDPYRWIEIRGSVDEITEEGAVDHINALAKSYRGRDDYYAPMPEQRYNETRVIYKIRPTHITHGG
jgi:PPOX class probable F420-dependent enzyme